MAAAISPDHRLYPEYRLGAELFQGLGAGFEGSVGARRLEFAAATTLYVGSLNKYVGNWLAGVRVFYLPSREGEESRTFMGHLRRYFGSDGVSFVGVRYSRGLAREEIRSLNDVDVLLSDTVSAEVSVLMARRLSVQVSAGTSRQDRVNIRDLRQHTATASLGVRF